jgi:hypothetical protein
MQSIFACCVVNESKEMWSDKYGLHLFASAIAFFCNKETLHDNYKHMGERC